MIGADAIDSIPAGVEFDFMTDIALPLPVAVAAAWMGLDVDAARLLREESPAIIRMLTDSADPIAVENGADALAALLAEFLPLAADRRRHPGDDLLSFIAADPDLELDDVVTTAIIVAIAGHETTANLLGTAIIRFLTPRRDGTRTIGSIDTIGDRLTSELLRLDGPVQAVGRTATCDHLVSEVTIRAGEPVLVVLPAANRDPAIFNNPNQFQPHRTELAPLTFGYGAHYCLGAALARLEIMTAPTHVLARRPVLRGESQWRNTPAIRGLQALPCAFAYSETARKRDDRQCLGSPCKRVGASGGQPLQRIRLPDSTSFQSGVRHQYRQT